MKRRALGKGLGILLPERAAEPATQGYAQIAVDKISPNPGQPRKAFDQAELEDLAKSIRGAGILQPVLVRPLESGRYELIAGERRLRAAKMAGLTRISARVEKVGLGRSLELALIENIQREQLNPIEEARAFSLPSTEYGLTQDEIANQVGRKRPSITNTLRLLKLPPRVQDLIRERRLTAGHAKALLALADEEEILRTAEAMANGTVSVRGAEKMTRRKGKKKAVAEEVGTDPNIRDAEIRLQRTLATKVRIKTSVGGRGRIEIDFHDDEELMRLFELIEGRTT